MFGGWSEWVPPIRCADRWIVDPRAPSSGLDITVGDAPDETRGADRPWLQVWFECAPAYQRVFRSADGSRYVATCPKCGKQIRFGVGDGGTAERFFRVSC